MMTETRTSQLEQAVNQTPDVIGNFKSGLGAIKGEYRCKIIVPDTRNIQGSLDIDMSTSSLYPHDNRWDYALEYDNETFFIEIHPGITSEITVVLNKLAWLKQWLKDKAPRISDTCSRSKPSFYWVYTSKFAILPNSTPWRKLAKNKLIPMKVWDYSKL